MALSKPLVEEDLEQGLSLKNLSSELETIEDWHTLGVKLNLEPKHLAFIEDNYPTERRKHEVLSRWLQQGHNCSWVELTSVLHQMQEHTVADEIQKKYLKKQSTKYEVQLEDYHYTEKLQDDLECPLCLQIFSNPTLTSCGHHFCRSCIDCVIQQNKPCPICKELNFNVFLDKSLNRKVSLVRVHCSLKEKGCKWVGELKYLKSHVDGDCGFVQVACEYGDVGCMETMLRKDMCNHMAENVATHLLLVSKQFVIQQAEIRNKVADLSQQLVEKGDENRRIQQLFHKKEEELANTKQQLQDQISDLHTKLESALKLNENQTSKLRDEISQKDRQIRILEQSVQNLQLQCPWSPFQFTVEHFSRHKRNKDVQYSQGFHTYPGGHKLCIAVYPNGHGEGIDTHVSLWLCCMHTGLDSQLKWPVKCTLKIELLNQEGDYRHHETTIKASWQKPTANIDRYGICSIESKFIKHSALNYDPTNSTQYLRDDCLHFRVTSTMV